ncbi:hypothetical protein SAMN05421754_101958 [Nitrosomonas sp. Nm58]|nr:hypothetical protein SAMN05421754_101958 [Nitrosomonas sp. Nm58]
MTEEFNNLLLIRASLSLVDITLTLPAGAVDSLIGKLAFYGRALRLANDSFHQTMMNSWCSYRY